MYELMRLRSRPESMNRTINIDITQETSKNSKFLIYLTHSIPSLWNTCISQYNRKYKNIFHLYNRLLTVCLNVQPCIGGGGGGCGNRTHNGAVVLVLDVTLPPLYKFILRPVGQLLYLAGRTDMYINKHLGLFVQLPTALHHA
jgi:hypothetical protein